MAHERTRSTTRRQWRAIINARLPLTDDGQRLWTIALDGDRITAIVLQTDVMVRPDDASVWDAKGRPVLPGFIDAHMHPVSMGLKKLRLDLSQVRSLRELLQVVGKTPRPASPAPRPVS
jgi:predicted amidohydrolase YtcJ